ncbi:MAG: leucine-rich repeat protein, partial [Alistipes sp.]|nr:leucine-rich repeat protein [Alistipes sp.]
MKEVKNILLLLMALFAVGCTQTIIFEDVSTPTPKPEINIPNNEIWYTSIDGTVVEPDSSADFGATIVSNTYENGKGVIKFNKDLYTIGQYAFDHKPILTVVLPKTVRVIEHDAFSYTPLKSVVLSDELTSIGAEAFEYCNLETIDFGDFIGDVGECAFSATDVKEVHVSSLSNWCSIDFGGWDANPLAGGGGATCLYVNNEKLTTLIFHNGLTEIKPYLFNHCKDLEEVVIHDNITRIGKYAFRYSDVRKVTIGKNVQYIGGSAFNCLSLMEIHCKSLTPPELENIDVFAQLRPDCKIYVPFESLDLYKSAYGWSTYADAIVADPVSEPTPEPTEPANNEIWYTSTDGKVVVPAETGYFDVSITSNTYSNGKGVITFSGPLTTIGRNEGEEPFANCAHNLKSVVLPNGLKTIGYGAFSL